VSTWSIILGLLGSVITLGLFVLNATFKLGHHAARIEALEDWRKTIRSDMHEISEAIQEMSRQMATLTALIEERTERRAGKREGAA